MKDEILHKNYCPLHCQLDIRVSFVVMQLFQGQTHWRNIFQEYENTVTSFNISSKVSHILTDYDSNMLKAFKLPGYKEQEEDSKEKEEENTAHDINDDENHAFDILPVEH